VEFNYKCCSGKNKPEGLKELRHMIRFRTACLGVVFSVCLGAFAQTANVTEFAFSELVSGAEAALKEKQPSVAVPLLKEIIARAEFIDDEKARASVQMARLQLGIAYAELQKNEDARRFIQDYLKGTPCEQPEVATRVLCQLSTAAGKWQELYDTATQIIEDKQIAIRHNIPVIGINRGHLGFLTDISPQEFATQLDAVLDGHYLRESRTLIHMRIQEDTTTHFEADALNDAVLSRGDETRLITFDVFINEQFVSHYRADGLIVATPTGSTAYALSAGGPILHPQLNAMAIVPMFSHSFSARPLVIDENSQINIRISSPNDIPLRLSCDGHQSYAIDPGQYVSIEKSSAQLQLLHPQEYRYYDTLRIKLGWGSER